MDDPSKRGEQDRERISLHQEHEVRYWTEKFGVSRDQLAAAIGKVGDSVRAVTQELGKA